MNYKALFLISLAVNVGVGFYAFRKSTAASEGPPKEKSSGPETLVATPSIKDVASTATNTAIKRFNWELVESSDYKQYIVNLRSVGCPEETIRDIIRADVNRLYDEKKRQVRKAAPKFEYWTKGDDFVRGLAREAWTKMFALDEERNAVLRALGIEPDYRMQMAKKLTGFELMLDFIEDESKKAQILRLHDELEDRLALRSEGTLDTRGIDLLLKEKNAAIKRLLTPEEELQYDLRLSGTANEVRHRLAAFEPTEQEFLSVFRLQKAFDDEFSMITEGDESPAERAKRAEAWKQLQEQIKQTLGTQRYADYEVAKDFAYQQMYHVAKQAGLGTPEAKQIYAMRKAAEEQAARIRTDQSLAPDQRATTLEGIRQETERSIHTVLGEKGWEEFNRGSNNRWLDRINPQSAAQPAAVPPP